jgi:hypothetical protein
MSGNSSTISPPPPSAFSAREPLPVGAGSRRNSNRLPIVIVMILSLLGSAGARFWADQSRAAAIPHQGGEVPATASLGSMNSFALGLLLGGLRGPLVMILWTESENAKSDKDLEGVDTQIEWIRLLQPEFDTVHIFQIWNKAYNISVQMASMANKYDVILGALDYAYKVDAAKPDDINIVCAIGQLYFDKLGMSAEKEFYRKRVREQTLPHMVLDKARSHDIGWRRVSLDPVLDESFNVLPALIKPRKGMERPANLPADQEWDDGSDLQYLPKFGPYPDGVCTFGLAYSYYKRAEVLQNVEHQHHDQLSDLVIDSRPALSLKFWGEAELEQGRRREMEAFAPVPNLPIPEDPDMYLGYTEHITLASQIADRHALDLAIADDLKATKLLPGSLEEYDRHILHFPEREMQYRSYREEIRNEIQLANADYEYLQAFVCPPAERDEHLAKANAFYRETRHLAYINLLRYYVDRSLVTPALPPGFSLERSGEHRPLEDLTLDQAEEVLKKATVLKKLSKNAYVNTDRYEFDRFVEHSSTREQDIKKALGGSSSSKNETSKPSNE